MVLVDATVWSRYIRGASPYLLELGELLRGERVVGHELVYGRLLMGDPGGGRKILAGYESLLQAPLVPHAEVVEFVKRHQLQGRGLSWIDAHLLASALVGHHQLWSADSELAAVAQELGVAY